ncbi:ABC transporter permease [Nonomuraea sp. MCN248]|uniref:ABC transporter permease n=1 Tax=Nonomuraea corallina TaxID=2989783 RepID=A0ABT4SEN4_9ACTN|nr:ABC transporter permease [Nonomuraea corallina]MDA0635396.1 ABC transporter permease [Nonomuraea corallina]
MNGAPLTRGAIGVAGFLVIGELVVRLWVSRAFDFPAPSVILYEAALLPLDPEFLQGMLVTVGNWGLGLLIAIGVAVPLGVLLGALPPVEQAVRPLVEFLRPIPSVAIIPLAILLIPNNSLMKVSVIVYASLWPILINTLYGMHDVDPLAKESMRTFGFGPLAVLTRVSLPSAAPFVATGVRIAAGIALVLAVSAELVAGGVNGLGVFAVAAGAGNRMDLIMAAALWAGIFGVLANVVLQLAERRLFRWHWLRTGGART